MRSSHPLRPLRPSAAAASGPRRGGGASGRSRGRGGAGRLVACAADPYKTLGIERGAAREELRVAYLAKVKQLHPDLNPGRDTTQECVAVNEAYDALCEGMDEAGDEPDWDDPFEYADGPARWPFVSPFAFSADVDPLRWREINDIIRTGMPGGSPEDALLPYGLGAPLGGVAWLSDAQLVAVEGVLGRMEETMQFDVAAYDLQDMLLRAARANARGPRRRRNEPVDWGWVERNGGADFW